MLYDNDLKDAMVDVLQNRMSAIADHIGVLLEQGYLPNKRKDTILSWSSILIHAYENIDIMSEEQQQNIDKLYNKVLNL